MIKNRKESGQSDTATGTGNVDRHYYIAGYGRLGIEEGDGSFAAGFSMYSAAWPMLDAYPGHDFQSGLFATWMHPDSEDPEIDVQARMKEDPDIVYKALFRHYRPTVPIIAAVEGVAIAGGTELLQAMEIRVAGESARFGVSEARWSLYPMGGSAVRLPKQIPYTQAAEILLTGKHIKAPEAKEIGLIGHVVPDGEALTKAREIADVVCANGPLAVAAITRTLHECDGMELDQALKHEWSYGNGVFASEDAKEGPLAFAQKRTPEFKGR